MDNMNQCPQCGSQLEPGAQTCKFCGASVGQPQQAAPQQPYAQQPGQPYPQQPYAPQPGQPYPPQPGQPYVQPPVAYDPSMQKSKIAAGLLGIFLGAWGIHNFYLGFTNKGILQIVLSVVTCGIAGIWGFIEGIMILVGNINVDARGIPLKD